MKRFVILLSAALLGLSAFGCSAQTARAEEPPICGGVTDNTDPNAPKEIKSKNIVGFSAMFFAHDKYDPDRSGIYRVQIADNENGAYVLTVSGVYEHELAVDDRVLSDVQAIIDEYSLVKMNGGGKVTAGLPPEWGPWMLDVTYDSGEKLSFYENGVPEADWTSAMRDYFVGLMAEAGFEDAQPPEEAVTIKGFSIAFDIGADYHAYGLAQLEDSTYLLHYAVDMDTQESTAEEFAVVTDALLAELQDVIAENGMDALHAPESVSFDLEGSKDGFLEIYVDYVSGRQIYGEYEAAELPEQWPEMKAALVGFLDAYIRENPAVVAG